MSVKTVSQIRIEFTRKADVKNSHFFVDDAPLGVFTTLPPHHNRRIEQPTASMSALGYLFYPLLFVLLAVTGPVLFGAFAIASPFVFSAAAFLTPIVLVISHILKHRQPYKVPPYKRAEANDSRSPCPGLNVLANHNILPHNGKDISQERLNTALKVYNLGPDVRALLVNLLWKKLNLQKNQGFALSQLSETHNSIEHDASLTREDLDIGNNVVLNHDLYKRFIKSSSNGKQITIEDFIQYKKQRQSESRDQNPKFTFGANQLVGASSEAIIVSSVFGSTLGGLPVEVAKSVFREERIPEGWIRPLLPITFAQLAAPMAWVAARTYFY
ncbi:hypothetical protein PROFUN_02512 [Planoprotostelium fungivorum]|uniref:Heme haloperoxidase family profile domain-containing protein n=1 Tax=Planoprotostelium fungivorum TaxID=1890364 RepID=A0A2P6MP65_9EUKA|nr:hypothetical protein PROFUN_02512 [Planoprotostelium fungivorum]